MIDVKAVGAAFPELGSIAILAEHGKKYVLRADLSGKDVVLKLLESKSPRDIERVRREVAAVSRLGCSYIPSVHDHGARAVCGVACYYHVEEFVPGGSYRERLEQEPIRPLDEVIHIGQALLDAACDFERSELIHRDIKPRNLILDDAGKLWVIDFGLVRLLDMSSITGTSQQWGEFTPGYAPPEQMQNRKAELNIRADLFAIGVVLYEALAGYSPYWHEQSSELSVIQQVLHQDLPRLTIEGDREGKLSELLGSLTARHAGRRPQTARDAADWFNDVVPSLDLVEH